MRRRLGLLVFCALTAFAAAPARACFAPYAHQLLDSMPDNPPAGASVIRVDFTNQGAAVQEWRGRVPATMGESRFDRRQLVGVVRRIDGQAADAFPIYARVTSCTPDFDVDPGESLTRRAWLVGRFVELGGQRVFVVLARGEGGRWEHFETD